MENISEINERIAKNLIVCRKSAGLTQAELAEKINYSDKSVSKWESGNGIPDVYTLLQIADLYGITLNDLVGSESAILPQQAPAKKTGLRVLIMLLSSGLVWLVAILNFVALEIALPGGPWWLAFLYAVVFTAVVVIVYASIWKQRILNFFAVSTLIWTAIASVYLTMCEISTMANLEHGALWFLFLLGVPLQILEVLWTFFRSLLRRHKKESLEENSNKK